MTPRSPEPKMKRTALFPGSFDPFTTGHMDILRRALALFDRVVVCVGVNSGKSSGSDAASRVEDIRAVTAGMEGVEVMEWSGLTVDAARAAGAVAMVRGVRSVADFEYERSLADLNRTISGIDTILLAADPALSAVSSSAVRELQRYGYDTSRFLPPKPDTHTDIKK